MPTIYIRGVNGVTKELATSSFLVSSKSSFDPNRGKTYTKVFKMAGGDGLNGMANDCKRRGEQYDLDSNPCISTLTVTTQTEGGQSDIAVDQWQMMTNENQLEVWESAAGIAIGVAGQAKIKAAVLDNSEGTVADTSGWTTNEIRMFHLLIRGQQTFPFGQHVLRHTTNAWSGYTSNVASTGVGNILSNDLLVSEISNGNYWTYPAPARIVFLVNAAAFGTSDDGEARWGWRKLPSNEGTAPNNRIEITTEYWHAQYPFLTFP